MDATDKYDDNTCIFSNVTKTQHSLHHLQWLF